MRSGQRAEIMNPLVIDISHYQPDPINWKQLKDAGTIGVIHKATEGNSYVDDKLFSRAKAATDAGLCWSTYHFLRPGSMTDQIDHYLNTINPKVGERICLDHEDDRVSLDDLCQCVDYILEKRGDLQITIYSGHLIKDQLSGKTSDLLSEYTSLWLAQYTTGTPSWPTQVWPAYSLWQYTDKGTAVGVTGNVDANQWNGTEENLIAWFGPAVEPEPVPEAVIVEITTPRTCNVQVVINGELLTS